MTAKQRFDESVQREIRRLIAKGRAQAESMEPPPWTDPQKQPQALEKLKEIMLESMEWPTQPCESMEFRDGQPPGYCCENCDEIDRRLEENGR